MIAWSTVKKQMLAAGWKLKTGTRRLNREGDTETFEYFIWPSAKQIECTYLGSAGLLINCKNTEDENVSINCQALISEKDFAIKARGYALYIKQLWKL